MNFLFFILGVEETDLVRVVCLRRGRRGPDQNEVRTSNRRKVTSIAETWICYPYLQT